jgi:hypothetical protein
MQIQQRLLDYQTGLERGIADLSRWKSAYDKIWVNKDFDQFNCVGFAFDGVLPAVAVGAFHPEVDFAGNRLQRLGAKASDYEHLAFNLTVLDGRSVAIIGWGTQCDGPGKDFAVSFARAATIEGGNAALQLAFEHIENTYFRPSWWQGLAPSMQEKIYERMRSGTPFNGRSADSLAVTERFVEDYSVIERFASDPAVYRVD